MLAESTDAAVDDTALINNPCLLACLRACVLRPQMRRSTPVEMEGRFYNPWNTDAAMKSFTDFVNVRGWRGD